MCVPCFFTEPSRGTQKTLFCTKVLSGPIVCCMQLDFIYLCNNFFFGLSEQVGGLTLVAHRTSMACITTRGNMWANSMASSGTTSKDPATHSGPPPWWSDPWTSYNDPASIQHRSTAGNVPEQCISLASFIEWHPSASTELAWWTLYYLVALLPDNPSPGIEMGGIFWRDGLFLPWCFCHARCFSSLGLLEDKLGSVIFTSEVWTSSAIHFSLRIRGLLFLPLMGGAWSLAHLSGTDTQWTRSIRKVIGN